MEENTNGSTAQIVGGVAVGLSVIALGLSVVAALGGFCCAFIPLMSSVLSGLSAVVSLGGSIFGYVTSNNEELDVDQQGKAKVGMFLSLGGMLLSLIAVAIACGPTIVMYGLWMVAAIFQSF